MTEPSVEEAIYLSDSEAPAFTFIDKAHQAKDGKGWRQSKDESAYSQPVHADAGDLPAQWTGEHVIHRLIEAFKTDRSLPKVKNKGFGSGHPQIFHTSEDKDGWLEMPAEDNQIRAKETREKLDQMQEAFGWLTTIAKSDPKGHFALKSYAKIKAYKRSIKEFCHKDGINIRTFRRRFEAAAGGIADALSACRTVIS